MNNKYYIPDKTELYFGYECEDFNPLIMNINNQYEKAILDETFDWEILMSDQEYINNNLRTKYLDVQDIESLGFKYETTGTLSWGKEIKTEIFSLNDIYLHYTPYYKTLILKEKSVNGFDLYRGKYKSINELKKLLKMVM